ncbi:hypothetical protein [Candidatus Finniella inopinata]|uniref:Glycosyltransferase family 2 protein n=1 Tax=Candidatus Finniella inopinata TaxID=1696036 RepID=A0A4Q7DJC5_9PROT|nr:hypothetical protein [Candidatus Finniella inopinata]RZI47101.1 hypothetical protein EQU50_00510 [Candidatus Finniella inopinata]
MITFFTTPKAFQGHIGIIQTNALTSWSCLTPKPEVILLGNDQGVKEAAEQFQFRHLPLESPGIPVLSEIFEAARAAASHDYLCFINADIILLDDFMPTFMQLSQQFEKFLMVSSRWNLDIQTILPLENVTDRTNLRNKAVQTHDMYPAGGTDFFVFHKDMFQTVPPFLLGRGYWDNWLMYQAKQENAPVIDVTADVIAVHQNHDYSHIKGVRKGDNDAEAVFKAAEGKRNLELAGGQKNIYTNYDADYVFIKGQFYKSWNLKFIFRRLKSSMRRLKIRLISQK